MNDLSVVVSRTFPVPAARVFEAWLDPEALAKFMTPGEGVTVPKATTDPVVGGEFEILMNVGDKVIPHKGFYKEINRHDRLVFTWDSPFSDPDSTVTLDFVEVDGGTEVTLTHVKFSSEKNRDDHKGGWTAILASLEPFLADVQAA